MVVKGKLPGPRAFKRSRALADTLETSPEVLADVSGLVKGNEELSKFSRVRAIMDISEAFTDERAKTYRTEQSPDDDDDDEGSATVVASSLVTIDEATRELIAMGDGTVGVRVGSTFGEAFLKRGDAYDCVSHGRDDGWTVRKRCSEQSLLRHVDRETNEIMDGEIVILETVA
ncbi:MAG: hypothetical protein CMI16_06815 [Opitutaceae bacterium]|nr:hypothetical protein [Opitutaceae bacterium]